LPDPPKFTQNWIFGLKTNHLATLLHWIAHLVRKSNRRKLLRPTYPHVQKVVGEREIGRERRESCRKRKMERGRGREREFKMRTT
jgi:hypothetical protein